MKHKHNWQLAKTWTEKEFYYDEPPKTRLQTFLWKVRDGKSWGLFVCDCGMSKKVEIEDYEREG